MRHRRFLVACLIVLAGCGGGQGGSAARPTVTPAGTPPTRGGVEAPPAASPGQPAAATATPAPNPPAATPAGQPAPATASPSPITIPTAPTAPARPVGDPAVSIVFQQPADGSIQAISAAGERLLLVDPTAPNQDVAWQPAPDGRTIAAVIFKGVEPKTGGYESAALWTVGVDAAEPRKLLDLGASPAPLAGGPALLSGLRRESWTADGRWIILPSNHEGQIDLYAVAADGSEVRRLTNTPEYEFDAVVAPGGAAVAYAATTSFGTGGGLGEPRAWIQPLFGEASPLTEADPAAHPIGVSVLGWMDDATPLALISYQPDGRGEIWTARAGEANLFHNLPAGAAWAVGSGRLALAQPAATGPNAAGPLFLWRGEGSEPLKVSDAAASVHLAPQPDRLLSCEGAGPVGGMRSLWLAGSSILVGPGFCDNLAWSESGRLALGPGLGQGGASQIIGPDGGILDATLPGGAMIAGWHGETVYFFGPAAGGDWQLYLLDTLRGPWPQPIGSPFPGQPAAPRVVAAR